MCLQAVAWDMMVVLHRASEFCHCCGFVCIPPAGCASLPVRKLCSGCWSLFGTTTHPRLTMCLVYVKVINGSEGTTANAKSLDTVRLLFLQCLQLAPWQSITSGSMQNVFPNFDCTWHVLQYVARGCLLRRLQVDQWRMPTEISREDTLSSLSWPTSLLRSWSSFQRLWSLFVLIFLLIWFLFAHGGLFFDYRIGVSSTMICLPGIGLVLLFSFYQGICLLSCPSYSFCLFFLAMQHQKL